MTAPLRLCALVLPLALAACDSATEPSAEGTPAPSASAPGEAPGDTSENAPWAGIGPDETIHFTGTEPFWGGEAGPGELTYSTPENIDGTTIAVERFAGRNGLSLSGEFEGAPFDMAITPGDCSDGMSDRTYPFTVTLQVEGEQHNGCAWTERTPFEGPEQP